MDDDYAREQLLKARHYADIGRYDAAIDCAQRAIDSLRSLIAQAKIDEDASREDGLI